jgi:hypothetical protein
MTFAQVMLAVMAGGAANFLIVGVIGTIVKASMK